MPKKVGWKILAENKDFQKGNTKIWEETNYKNTK